MMIVVHEFVAPAEQIAVEPAALCTAGSYYVRKPLREERSFVLQRSGDGGWTLRGSDVDNSICVLFPLA